MVLFVLNYFLDISFVFLCALEEPGQFIMSPIGGDGRKMP